MLMVQKNTMIKRMNPELYKAMMASGFKDTPLKDAFDRSLYMMDGEPGLFIQNANFAYVLCGSLQRSLHSDNLVIDDIGAFFYHLKRGGYSYKGNYHIGKAFSVYYVGTKEDTPQRRHYESQSMRVALKLMARDVPMDAAPKKPNQLFDIHSHWRTNAVLDKMNR